MAHAKDSKKPAAKQLLQLLPQAEAVCISGNTQVHLRRCVDGQWVETWADFTLPPTSTDTTAMMAAAKPCCQPASE